MDDACVLCHTRQSYHTHLDRISPHRIAYPPGMTPCFRCHYTHHGVTMQPMGEWTGSKKNMALGWEAKRTHGMYRSSEYRTWAGMKARCLNPNNGRWKDYGGRGIKVCKQWFRFECFLKDMGKRPKGTSLDRFPNRNGNYEPSNCRWATPKEQQRNMRSNLRFAFKGEQLTVPEIAERIGAKVSVLRTRMRRGWSPKDAFTIPIGRYIPRS